MQSQNKYHHSYPQDSKFKTNRQYNRRNNKQNYNHKNQNQSQNQNQRKEKIEKKPINLLETLNFPNLSQTVTTTTTEKKNYKILCDQICNDQDNKHTNENDNIKNTKWTILSNIPNKLNVIKNLDASTNDIDEKEYISPNKIYKCYNEMCTRWNKYRDEINNLYGDTSPYYDYQIVIKEMIDENNIIYNELYENNNNYSSDEEASEYEYNDFYYK